MRVLLSFFLLAPLVVLSTTLEAQNPLRETQASTPKIVRTEYDMAKVATAPSLAPGRSTG